MTLSWLLRRSRGLASLPVRHPWLTVLLWLALASAVELTGQIVHSPASSSSSVPASAESRRADGLESRFTGGHKVVEVLIVDSRGLGGSDQMLAGRLRDWLQSRPRAADIMFVGPEQRSPDGEALMIPVTFRSAAPPPDGPDPRIASIERHLTEIEHPGAVRVGLAGDLAVNHDVNSGILGSGSSGGSQALRALGVLLIVVVFALVYRAPLAVLIPIVSIGVVLLTSSSLARIGAATAGLPVNSFSLPFVYAVILGTGTNYGLFLISRYREELRRGGEDRQALEAALRGVAPAIASSAATVALGTAAMTFTSLGFFHTLGPALALSIVVMLAAGLTLTPALVAITGQMFFWPRRPVPETSAGVASSRAWERVGRLVTLRPAPVLAVALAVLVLPILALRGLEVSVDLRGSLPAGSPSLAGYRMLEAHFPAATQTAPLFVTTPVSTHRLERAKLDEVREAMRSVPGVMAVSGPSITSDGSTAGFQLGLTGDASSERASTTLTKAEAAARQSLAINQVDHAQVLAGGEVAADRDLRQLLAQDFLRVAVLVGVAIYAVLAVLLRNLFAPVYLLASVALSTAAAIGAVAFLYRGLAGQPLYWAVPVFAFVFLVVLGEDFNIYLVSRLRQELSVGDSGEGITRAVALTGGVITSAGLVMAAAFFTFLGNPVPLVQQLGTVVVVGLLLDTLVVRSFLVPALARLLGPLSGISARRREPGKWAPDR